MPMTEKTGSPLGSAEPRGYILSPSVETLGGWHPQAIKVIRTLGRQLARQTGREDSEVTAQTFQRLSIMLMKGNSALIINRAPPNTLPGELPLYIFRFSVIILA